jgi:hypothetical protein
VLLFDEANELVMAKVYLLLTLNLGKVEQHDLISQWIQTVIGTQRVVGNEVLPQTLLWEIEWPFVWILYWVLIDATREEIELQVLFSRLGEYHDSSKSQSILGKSRCHLDDSVVLIPLNVVFKALTD